MTKICSKCKKEKPLSEFNKQRSRPSGRQSRCRECLKEHAKEYYQNNKKSYAKRNKNHRKMLREWFVKLKTTLSCECGENHPGCLVFHHTDGSTKETTVANAISDGWSITRIEKEIAKCIVMCHNCHEKLHWNERNPEYENEN